MASVYEIVTEKIVTQLEAGNIPWHKPWNAQGGKPPMNLISKKPYNGINFFMLGMSGYGSPYWLTFKQCSDKGGCVRKGEKSTMVVFWNIQKKRDQDGKDKSVAILRYYNVFNVEQCDNLDIPAIEAELPVIEFNPIDRCESIVNCFENGPSLAHGGIKAYYSPSADHVQMPNKETFKTAEHYYATLFHELGHSTGHKKRLNRAEMENVQPFGSPDYSREELVAEMTSAFLCNAGCIDQPDIIENTVAYLQGWAKKLREDVQAVIYAAGRAQKAANMILNVQTETIEE